MDDKETLEACCKLMARIFSKQAENLNATDITFMVDEITNKEDNKPFGSVKVLWTKATN